MVAATAIGRQRLTKMPGINPNDSSDVSWLVIERYDIR